MNNLNVAVLGGDMRHNYLADELAKSGFNVYTFAQENGIYSFDILKNETKIDIYIFPMPISLDSVHLNGSISTKKHQILEIIKQIPRKSLIFGGSISPTILELFSSHNLDVIDYLNRDELAILNAIPTAEGAIAIAFNELPITLYKSKSLVLGNGRIGKILSKKLSALGSDVTVSARKFSDFADISSNNLNFVSHNDIDFTSFDVIFNTIPKLVIDTEHLEIMPKNTLIIDLASRPGGVNFDSAEKLEIKTIWAQSLPGKVAPISSANYIFQTIINILTEMEVIK